MRPRDLHKETLVKQKTIELIVTDGLESFSMNKLAKACDISVATLYIYYKHKDDLINQIAAEEGQKMAATMTNGLMPDTSFEDGLRIQWKNRYAHSVGNPLSMSFFEQIRNSSYQEEFQKVMRKGMESVLGDFMHRAMKKGEINKMPFEVYWSLAFSPLYALIRFSNEGRSVGGRPFKMTDELMWQTFDLVIKALKN